MNLDYKLLKSAIIRSCKNIRPGGDARDCSISFIVNYDKLIKNTDGLGIIPINLGTKSKQLDQDMVPLMSEYLKGQNLSWLNTDKHFTIISFVQADSMDDELEKLLMDLNTCREDNPEIDKVKCAAEILAKYPCYSALVVSYIGNDPQRHGLISYEIKVRANAVTIKQDGYGYKHQDI